MQSSYFRKPFPLLFCLSLTMLLTATLPGFGQGRDTVFAVHKLFAEKQRGGADYSAASAAAVSPTRYTQRPNGRPTAQEARQDALASAAFATVGWLKTDRYSPEREAAIVNDYALGNPIPSDIRCKLRRKHFHLSARDLGGSR